MRNLIVLIISFLLFSCNEKAEKPEATKTRSVKLDVEKELAEIEQMRTDFQNTVKEKRYEDLGNFATRDMISVGPGSEEWIAYRKLREENGNKFRYDSIKMTPKETVIVSDSIAYDFGVSSMYYTDEGGKVHELEDTFLVILKKTRDGKWKLHRELASSKVD